MVSCKETIFSAGAELDSTVLLLVANHMSDRLDQSDGICVYVCTLHHPVIASHVEPNEVSRKLRLLFNG